jgi:hypothetical protein
LQNENTNLISHNAQKDIFIAESKAEIATKSKKIRSLESIIKILEGKLSSAQKDVFSIQNDSLKKEAHSALFHKSEIISLKSKIAEVEQMKSELESKVNELECLKSEDVSKPVIGGNDEKNIIKNSDLSKYFIRGKNMDPIEKIDGNARSALSMKDMSTYTNDKITELSKNDTEINPKINEETSISENNKDNSEASAKAHMLDISIKPNVSQIISENMTPHLAQRENNSGASAKAHMFSLIESHSQILIGGIGGIGAIPVMTSTLMSPLSAYIFLTLLIIAVMWFVILRHSWGFERKNERLWDMWVG